MQYSTNYNMNKPELAEQYRLSHWNENTDIIDTELKRNADAISAETNRATNAETALQNITNATFKNALLDFCYPIGSIYWSGVATNPHDLFGGTWEQIKDKFIWAKGDNDTLNATGGAKTVTLTTDQIPSHNHSFTPSGTISVTTNPTFSGSAVNTDSKGSHSHSTNSTKNSAGTANKTLTGVWTPFGATGMFVGNDTSQATGIISISDSRSCFYPQGVGSGFAKMTIDVTHSHTTDSQGAHTHSVKAEGTISGGAYKFTGSAGTTGSKGGGGAHNNMPPYIVKYCWQRTE